MSKDDSEETLKKMDIEIDSFRETLYEVACDSEVINSCEKVLDLSRKLDDLILNYIKMKNLIDKSNTQ
ncbi:MAG: hypothetical protein K0R54_3170 [Clostridiaceae bacterium]|jgi:hypothetical protein|nr:hypothetical protein [Clostridiaceae bacterium]